MTSEPTPYVLSAGEGRRYEWYGMEFIVKAGSAETHGASGFMEFITRRGEEPPPHVHLDEDEVFYLFAGDHDIRCGDKEFSAGPKDFVFLPRNIEHSYTITSADPVRMLVITAPNRFVEAIEQDGTRTR